MNLQCEHSLWVRTPAAAPPVQRPPAVRPNQGTQTENKRDLGWNITADVDAVQEFTTASSSVHS